MAFLYFSLDGLISDTGQEKILEINRGTDSGDDCYRALTRRSMMDVMMWQLREAGWFDHIWFEQNHMGYKENFKDGRVPDCHRAFAQSGQMVLPRMVKYELTAYDKEDLNIQPALWDKSKRHLIFPEDSMPYHIVERSSGVIKKVRQPNIDYRLCESIVEETHNPNIVIADGPPVFFEMDKNKAFFARMVRESGADSSFFPDEEVFTLKKDGSDIEARAESILTRFAACRKIVIKDTGLVCGANSYFLENPDSEEMQRVLAKWLSGTPVYTNRAESDTAELIVQEHIHTTPMAPRECFERARSEASNLFYNPVSANTTKRHHGFRVFASYYNGDILFHDACYNFSDASVNSEGQEKFLSEHNFSAPMSRAQKAEMFERLRGPLLQLFGYAETVDFTPPPPSSEEKRHPISPIEQAEIYKALLELEKERLAQAKQAREEMDETDDDMLAEPFDDGLAEMYDENDFVPFP